MIETTESPAWPTTLRSRLRDGRLMGIDGSVWVYRKVPMSPVIDARGEAETIRAAAPLLAAYEEIADLASVTVKRRAMAKGSYRQTHALLVNVPQFFTPDRSHPNAEYLRSQFGQVPIDRRLLLFGVKLQDKVGGTGGWRAAVDSVVESMVSGQIPLSDFDGDFAVVDAALERAGLVEATSEEIRLANGWWNHGEFPDTPMLVHADHLHIFNGPESVNIARAAGVEACHTWASVPVPGQHAVTFASVQDLELDFVDPASRQAAWIADLLDAEALTVSIRGNVEPSAVTREELRRQKKRYIDDINERVSNGKMERAEQQEMLDMLHGVEGMYSRKNVPATLAGASIVVGLNGQVSDINQVVHGSSPVKLAVMAYRQNGGLDETMLCSPRRQNPNLHDLPVHAIACSGAPSLNHVGDKDGALLGFTERDRQPSYLSPTAASTSDGLPIALCAGATGSGKTMLLLDSADQFARMGRPVIIIDPKQGSDHSAAVEATGGQVSSLDTLASADGIFDPVRFSAKPEVGVELAASMLMSINPWGQRKDDMEVPLTRALHHGVVTRGATCIGQALAYAAEDLRDLPAEMIPRIQDLAASSSMFRACVGVNPGTTALRAAEGITLIKVGDAHLDLPEPGAVPASIGQRVALALVRMMVFGSAMALTGRGGVVMLDEAWVFLGAGKAEVERLGRLARSQQVLPMLFTQRVTDAVNAGLSGYISRGLILPIEDEEEAKAACTLFKLEPTPDRLARITAKGTMGDTDASVAPNWNSMRALRDPKTGQVIRGSIAIYADLSGRAIPVEVTLGEEFLRLASTNPEDIARRREEQAARAALLAAAAVKAHTVTEPDTGGAVVDKVF